MAATPLEAQQRNERVRTLIALLSSGGLALFGAFAAVIYSGNGTDDAVVMAIIACSLYPDRSLLRSCCTRRPNVLVPGISDQLLVALMIIGAALGFTGFIIIDGRRLDARIRRERERAAASPRPEK